VISGQLLQPLTWLLPHSTCFQIRPASSNPGNQITRNGRSSWPYSHLVRFRLIFRSLQAGMWMAGWDPMPIRAPGSLRSAVLPAMGSQRDHTDQPGYRPRSAKLKPGQPGRFMTWDLAQPHPGCVPGLGRRPASPVGGHFLFRIWISGVSRWI